MKLTKISLAALVALGAFSSVASATPLEEAIKNVDLSGYARYRYTNDNFKDQAVGSNPDHRFRFIGSFKAALDDNFFGVLTLRYDARDSSGSRVGPTGTPPQYTTDKTDTTSDFNVQEFYLGYTYGNTTVTAGKQLIKTFFDDDVVGTGIRITNKDIEGLSIVAAAYDALAYDFGLDRDGPLLTNLQAKDDISLNLYTVGVMGNYDPVAFSIWYANLEDAAALYAGDIALNFDVSDVNLNLHGQYVHNEADHNDYKNADFYAIQAGVGAFGIKFNAGYLNFEADDIDSSTVGTSFVSIEDNGKLINPTKILNGAMSSGVQYYNNIKGENDYWFVNASYKYDKYSIGAGYTDGEGYSHQLAVKDADRKEWYAQLGYQYSKKLNFTTWYAQAKEEKGDRENQQDRFRFEAKYSF